MTQRNSLDDEILSVERALRGSTKDYALQDRLDTLRIRRSGPLRAEDERELWVHLWRMIRRARQSVPRRGVDLSGFRQAAMRAIRAAATSELRNDFPRGVAVVEVFRCGRCARVQIGRPRPHEIARRPGCGECPVQFCVECENEGPSAHPGYHSRCREEYFTTWVGAAAVEDAMRRLTICVRAIDRPVSKRLAGGRYELLGRPPEGALFPELATRVGLSAPALDRVQADRSIFCVDPPPPGEEACVFPPPLVRMVSWCEMLHRWDGTPVNHQCRKLPIEILRAEVRQDGEHVLALLSEFELDGPMTYRLGDLQYEGITCDERTSTGRMGDIEIGGDQGDVLAREATNYGDGVTLHGAILRTTHLGLTDDQAADTAREIIGASYDSVGFDTFRQSHRER